MHEKDELIRNGDYHRVPNDVHFMSRDRMHAYLRPQYENVDGVSISPITSKLAWMLMMIGILSLVYMIGGLFDRLYGQTNGRRVFSGGKAASHIV
jgi:hypothetical protein